MSREQYCELGPATSGLSVAENQRLHLRTLPHPAPPHLVDPPSRPTTPHQLALTLMVRPLEP